MAYTDDLKRLIDKWGNKDRSPDNYVFRYLNEDMTEKQTRRCLDRLIKRTNDHMKKIATEVGIEKIVTVITSYSIHYTKLYETIYTPSTLRELGIRTTFNKILAISHYGGRIYNLIRFGKIDYWGTVDESFYKRVKVKSLKWRIRVIDI